MFGLTTETIEAAAAEDAAAETARTAKYDAAREVENQRYMRFQSLELAVNFLAIRDAPGNWDAITVAERFLGFLRG